MNTIEKIRSLREQVGLTQDELATKLGISRPTYIAIESGKRQLTVSELATIAATFEVTSDELLYDTSHITSDDSGLDKYKQLIVNTLSYGGDTRDSRLPKTKLAKLVYLADFAWYYDHFESISKMPYRCLSRGPVPNDFFRALDDLYEEGVITVEYKNGGTVQLIGLVEENPSSDLLSKGELGLIEKITTKWRDRNTQEIVKFTHNQLPWKICRPGEVIPYELITQEDPGNVY